MKREYGIGGLFLLVILVILIGVTYLGRKPEISPKPAMVSESPKAETHPTPITTPKTDILRIAESQIPNPTVTISDASSTISSATQSAFRIEGCVRGKDDKILPGTKITVHLMDSVENGFIVPIREG